MTVSVAYINLRSRSDRDGTFLSNNRAELDAAGFPWRRSDGVDGSRLGAEDLVARGIIARDGLPEGYEPHTLGHLGAALSHRSLWEQAGQSGDDDVLVILEDDAQLCPQFGARLRRVLESAKKREPWDVLHLGFNTDAPLTIQLDHPRIDVQLICQENGGPIGLGAPFTISWPDKPYEGETLLARVIDIHGIPGYAVSTRGARRLLDACFPMSATSIDGTMSRKTAEGVLQALIAIPPLVLSPNDHADSDTVRSAVLSGGTPLVQPARTPAFRSAAVSAAGQAASRRYYTEQFPRAIYDSKPVPCGGTRGYEVHILTCERDRTIAFWALKSFYYYLGEHPPLVVHDDGSLTEESLRLFDDHFPGCTVLRADRADADPQFRESLKSLPLCELWRFRSDFQLAKKLFDFPSFSTEPLIVGLDSDILFFRKPTEILEYVRTSTPFMSSDYQDAYEFAPEDFELIPRLNSGLFGLHRDAFDFTLVEKWLEAWVDATPARRFEFWKGWLEQTMLACLFSRSAGGRALELSRYQISSMLISDQTISQHFVKDGSRSAFYHWGLRKLDEAGFLAAVS